MAPTDKPSNVGLEPIVDIAILKIEYGHVRGDVDKLMKFMEDSKSEKTWYKAYATATITICGLLVSGISWAANNKVVEKVEAIVNQNRPVVQASVKP